jgi:multidrug efflux pump
MLKNDLPPGFRLAWAGESKEYKDTGNEILFIMGLALIIVYMTLAAQFESLVHPLTVMLAVPLAGFGAFGLLWLVNFLSHGQVPAMNINLFTRLGRLAHRAGDQNSILLVEFANQRRAAGATAMDAIEAVWCDCGQF